MITRSFPALMGTSRGILVLFSELLLQCAHGAKRSTSKRFQIFIGLLDFVDAVTVVENRR